MTRPRPAESIAARTGTKSIAEGGWDLEETLTQIAESLAAHPHPRRAIHRDADGAPEEADHGKRPRRAEQ